MIAKFTGTEDGKRELMRIWLEGNRQAHDFISEEYWLSHFDQVGEALSSAEDVYKRQAWTGYSVLSPAAALQPD